MKAAASIKLSEQFKETFEIRSQCLFEANKRKANLNDPLVSVSVRSAMRVFNELCETHLDFTSKNEFKRQEAPTKEVKRHPTNYQIVFRYLVVYLCIKQLIAAAFQYMYDFTVLEYDRAKVAYEGAQMGGKSMHLLVDKVSANWSSFNSLDLSSHLMRIQNQKAERAQILRGIGAPFIDMTFFIECGLIFSVVSMVCYYAAPMIICKLKGPFSIGLIRVLIDENYDCQNVNQLILDEIEHIIQFSGQCLTESFKDAYNIYQDGNNMILEQDRSESINYVQSNFALQHSITSHNNTVKLLKRLAQSGKLHPANRMPKWISTISFLFKLGWITFGIFELVVLFVLIIISDHLKYARMETGLMDIISYVEFISLISCGTILAQTWLVLYFYAFVDQYYIVSKLNKRWKTCIEANGRNESLIEDIELSERKPRLETPFKKDRLTSSLFQTNSPSWNLPFKSQHRHSSTNFNRNHQQSYRNSLWLLDDIGSSGGKPIQLPANESAIIEEMNENLLELLASYRIFVGQFKPLKEFFSRLTSYIQAIYILYPLFAIAHVHYIDRYLCILLVGEVFAYVVIYNSTLIPVCAYHAQCKGLQETLFTLLAHIVELQNRGLTKNYIVYNPYIVSLLHREIRFPRLALRRISIITYGRPLSYMFVLRVQFWASILAVYALSTIKTQSNGAIGNTAIWGILV